MWKQRPGAAPTRSRSSAVSRSSRRFARSPLLGVSDLAREVGLSRSTTHRYISTLAALGYLQQDPATRKYRLGPRVLDLGFSAINSMDLREVAVPHLQALSDETGRTVNMAVLDGVDIVYIERCRTSERPARHRPESPHRFTPARLLHLDGQGAARGLEPGGQRRCSSRSVHAARAERSDRSRGAARRLERVRVTGLAVNNEELAYGLRSIAAPVRSPGEVVAAINLAVHRTMVSLDSLVAHLGPPLKRTAAEISARIGYRSAAYADVGRARLHLEEKRRRAVGRPGRPRRASPSSASAFRATASQPNASEMDAMSTAPNEGQAGGHPGGRRAGPSSGSPRS